MARRKYVSIKEVAARAVVSFQTASKVLNGGDVRVSAETAARIVAAAEGLGYRPNTIARRLVQRSTATPGVVARDATAVAITLASVAAEQAARRHGHAVLVGHLAPGGGDGASIAATLIERRVDGVIAAAPDREEDAEVGDLLRPYGPAVSLQSIPGGGIPLVGSNHRDTGRIAAEHLIGLGHTAIGTVAGPFPRAGDPKPPARVRGRAAGGRDRAGRRAGGRGRLDAGRRGGRDPGAAGTGGGDDRAVRAQRHHGPRS